MSTYIFSACRSNNTRKFVYADFLFINSILLVTFIINKVQFHYHYNLRPQSTFNTTLNRYLHNMYLTLIHNYHLSFWFWASLSPLDFSVLSLAFFVYSLLQVFCTFSTLFLFVSQALIIIVPSLIWFVIKRCRHKNLNFTGPVFITL